MVGTSNSFLSLTNLTIREQHIDSRTMERGNYSNTEVSDTTRQSQINRGTAGNETLKSNPLRSPPATSTGWASMGSTTAFRAINFELFVKPNKFVMACGIIAFTSCVSYIVYMNLTDDKKKVTYVTLDEDGGTTVRQKTSRWY